VHAHIITLQKPCALFLGIIVISHRALTSRRTDIAKAAPNGARKRQMKAGRPHRALLLIDRLVGGHSSLGCNPGCLDLVGIHMDL